MLKSILVGLDGSPSGTTAIELGIEWAKKFNALLVGLGIVDEVSIRTPEVEPLGSGYYKHERDEELVQKARQAVAQLLEQFGVRCAAANVSFNLLEESGSPADEILRESQRYDLVLFGHDTHFRFGMADRPDETPENVLKRGSRPVVIAPPKLDSGSTVVLAYDGSPHADRALQAFQASGLDLEEEVCIFSTDSDPQAAARQAQRAAEFLRLHRINAVADAVGPVDSVPQSIVAEVRRRNARLLVMGAYGHSLVREYLLGSTTAAVLKDSPVPVFLCH